MKRTWKVLLILSDVIGWLFWLMAALFLVQYINEVDNPLRHELGVGMAMGFLYGVWPALFSLAVSIYFRKQMQKWLLLMSLALLPAFGVVLGAYNAIAT
jgi:ABC-type transport system involved in multi-copper enzyme maturation permease subunit